jgi:hypothetical protein
MGRTVAHYRACRCLYGWRSEDELERRLAGNMISELDIWRDANLPIVQHGRDYPQRFARICYVDPCRSFRCRDWMALGAPRPSFAHVSHEASACKAAWRGRPQKRNTVRLSADRCASDRAPRFEPAVAAPRSAEVRTCGRPQSRSQTAGSLSCVGSAGSPCMGLRWANPALRARWLCGAERSRV